MLVSILVPIYKVEKYIEKCLDSIFNQTYSDIEYVFVDDCSPDNSLTILRRYIDENDIDKNKVTIISHCENKGISITRNDLIDHAKGTYVLFVDSDDWIETDMIEQMVLATKNNTIDIVGCDYIKEFKDGKHKNYYENYSNNCHENLIRMINYNIGPTMWKFMIKKILFNSIRFPNDINIGEDYVTSIRLYYYAKSCSCVHKNLYHYIQYNENSYSNKIEESISYHIKAILDVEAFLKSANLYNEKIDRQIKIRKFNIKHYYLFLPLLDYLKWKNTFPDSDKMWRYMKYSRKEKIIYWLSEKHLFSIIKLLRHIKKLV